MGPNQDFAINKMLMAQIAKLSRMPELEKQIMNYQPQPDPLEEQAKQLEMAKMQLEIELMKAEIRDKNARAGENEIDMQVKANKAKLDDAKARKLNSESDLHDLSFLKENEGISDRNKRQEEEQKYTRQRQAQIEDRDHARLHELDKIALQGMMQPKKDAK